ncbi:hypothetical protein HETIRDRAFT_455355 [Heterobasidion irregulare TC 32-1]|uniref:Uncharacterized protein n=1 Tax=Heterobasidion irregulare (strain TC 32-1) TaxID=747525 RepID=W4JV58_HETIT|nr:uncharacterized protein HETIRDRAFT_455355 [Heterobasidion irregulare TC 32-1]ETW76965.1 hypothetical protein HETIRDRAFT_455355 [Heterobasidion irregulare TC 32-1]
MSLSPSSISLPPSAPSSSPVHAHLSPSTSSPRCPQRPILRLYPPPPLVRSTSPTSDPLSRPTCSPVQLALPPGPLDPIARCTALPALLARSHAHWPTGRLARIVHIVSRIAWLDTTAVHHPGTSSASSTFVNTSTSASSSAVATTTTHTTTTTASSS